MKIYLTPRFYIALLRMMIGLIFLTAAYSNWENGYYSEEGLHRFFSEVFPQSQNPFGWYAQFINTTILPIASTFSIFLVYSEVLMGVALLGGILTPIISVGAMIFIMNTFLAIFGQDWPWSYIMIDAILFTVIATQSGRTLGIDGLLARRFGTRRWYLW